MSKNKFTSSSKFLSKLDAQNKKLQSKLQQQFLQDVVALREDDFDNLNVYIEDAGVRLRHQCVVHAICPILLETVTDLTTNEVFLDTYPTGVCDDAKKLLDTIYLEKPPVTTTDNSAAAAGELDFSSLLESGEYSDVTFEVDGINFQCHRCILSSRCEYFSMMLGGNWREKEQDVIELKNVSSATFALVLRLIYAGDGHTPTSIVSGG